MDIDQCVMGCRDADFLFNNFFLFSVDVAVQKIDFGKLFRGKSMDKPKGKGGKPQGGAVKKSGNQALSGSK